MGSNAVRSFLVLTACSLLFVSCKTRGSSSGSVTRYTSKGPVMKPVVAVADFENKASFSGQWNLGEGVADMLVTELMESDRVVVLERKNIGDVIDELVRQGQSFFREEGRVEKGRLKNAQYMLRGVITDFTVTGDASGWFGYSGLKVSGKSSKARVAIIVKVYDVGTGEVLSSVRADGEVSAGGSAASINYKDIVLGGDAYYRTPLGKATDIALGKAVKAILDDLPEVRWQPRVAEVQGARVTINGGKNVRIKKGKVFAVRKPGRNVTDPVTGNVIDYAPGAMVGKIRVTEVGDVASYAEFVEGSAARGDHLEEAK
jgi:curli biogenesis system outer membrane secretion channel CsgG